MYRQTLIAAVLTLGLSGCIINVNASGYRAEFLETRQLTLNAAELSALQAETGAGDLHIKEVDGLQQIRVTATIYGKPGMEYELTLEQHLHSARLIAKADASGRWQNSPYIDLTVEVPVNLNLKVSDGSGDIVISGGQNINIDDGSGDIHITNSHGELEISDGSGAINILHHTGRISIDDGSGEIRVASVNGDLYIKDGSGSINTTDVSGNVTIDDGSGDIQISHAGSLNIVEAGSGNLIIDGVSNTAGRK
ncbi:DUF4097 family beta strand repeat-containing protein [Shewanella sp. GXUN23E]|uniref:DUF4097 family beta strand repeat-containing protein n=1 Tax=Shewanella sp. GXUN23E TaxID=3422498 RepID=UPI003D7E10F7